MTQNACQHAAAANLLGDAAQVLAIGDTQYNRGALSEYQGFCDPTWGAYRSFTRARVNSIYRDSTHFGVLELNLHPSSYDWAFRATDATTLDLGSASCH